MGRPSEFDEEKHVKAALLSVVEGATWEAIARQCGKATSTVRAWADEETGIPAFSAAVKEAQATVNSHVKTGLYKNATGSVTKTKTKTVTVELVELPRNKKLAERILAAGLVDANGMITVRKTVETEVETEHKGETGAQVFWLCNRLPNEWRHVSRIEEAPSEDGVAPIIDDIPLGESSSVN